MIPLMSCTPRRKWNLSKDYHQIPKFICLSVIGFINDWDIHLRCQSGNEKQKYFHLTSIFIIHSSLLPFDATSVLAPSLLNFFSCSAQLRLDFILLINVKMPTIVGILTNVKMPTIVGILTFISRIIYWL